MYRFSSWSSIFNILKNPADDDILSLSPLYLLDLPVGLCLARAMQTFAGPRDKKIRSKVLLDQRFTIDFLRSGNATFPSFSSGPEPVGSLEGSGPLGPLGAWPGPQDKLSHLSSLCTPLCLALALNGLKLS